MLSAFTNPFETCILSGKTRDPSHAKWHLWVDRLFEVLEFFMRPVYGIPLVMNECTPSLGIDAVQ